MKTDPSVIYKIHQVFYLPKELTSKLSFTISQSGIENSENLLFLDLVSEPKYDLFCECIKYQEKLICMHISELNCESGYEP